MTSTKQESCQQKEDHNTRVKIGEVPVNSGHVIVADPSFLEYGGVAWDQFVAAAFPDGPGGKDLPHFQYSWFTGDKSYQIVAATSGYGIGMYDVFAVVRPDGLIKSVEIVFIKDESGSAEGTAAEAGRE